MNETLWAMPVARALFGRPDSHPNDFFDDLAELFLSRGATHILIAGIPLPGKDLGKQILFSNWPRPEREPNLIQYVKGQDPLLRHVAMLENHAFWSPGDPEVGWLDQSALIQLLRQTGQLRSSYQIVAALHLHSFDQFQIGVFLAGETISFSDRDFRLFGFHCRLMLEEMQHQHAFFPMRPGTLSLRERIVLSLTAQGMTASDIAGQLHISKRTVHAHLQNASDKMQAANKTQTVVEAVRYGQIQLI